MSKGPGKAARAKALRMGEALITRYSHGNTMPGREAAMWALLCHATQVSRLAFQAPPRTGYPVASPGAILAVDDVSDWQRVAAYLRGELDSVDSASARPAQPSAEEISAAEVVLTVFHRAALRGYGDWRRLRGAVYVHACGAPPRKIYALTGINRNSLRHARDRALRDMLADWEK